MSEPRIGSTGSRALWRRWTAAGEAQGNGAAAPDAMDLAAFAEDRLTDPAHVAIAAYIANHPELAEDVAVAREFAAAARREDEAALAAAVERAAQLVPAESGIVLSFRPLRRAPRNWQAVARWGALAASFALVSWLGFALGSDVVGRLDRQTASIAGAAEDLLDPPAGFFGIADTSGT